MRAKTKAETTRRPVKPKKKAARSSWPVQEARAQLSAVIDAALAGKPQRITRNGKDAVVVVRATDFAPKKAGDMKRFMALFQNSPLTEALEEDLIDFDAIRREDPPLGPPIDFDDERFIDAPRDPKRRA